jgi:hypothetical protein
VLTRSFGVLAIAAVVVACSSAGTPSAPSASNVAEHASPTNAAPTASGSTVSDHDLYRDSLLNPTFDVLSELPGFQAGGLEPDRDEILVYWHGEFGPEAQAAVAEAESRGVPVNVIFVPYSYDQLRKIAGRLVSALSAKGIDIQGRTIGDPFDVITVWGSALDESAELRRLAEDTAADVLPSNLRFAIITSPPTPLLLPAFVPTPT